MNYSSVPTAGGVGIHRGGGSKSRAGPVLTQRGSGIAVALNSDLNLHENAASARLDARNSGSQQQNNQKIAMQRRNTNGGGLSSQTQKFSFGNLGEELATPKAILQQRNALNLQAMAEHANGLHPGAGKPSCHTAREPVNRGVSCLQTFTQRHQEAAAIKQGQAGGKVVDVTSMSTSNEGNILTFRGSRHNNESQRENLQTDRQNLQQTTFGNLATARGKVSPANGSAEVHVQSLIGQFSSIHNKIQSEHGFVRNLTNVNSPSESTQLKISGGGNMAKYLEDHTNTADEQKSKEGDNTWDEKCLSNLYSASELLLRTWKNQTAAAYSKDSSLNTTRIQHGSSIQQYKSNAHSQASSANQWTSHNSEAGGAQQYRTERAGGNDGAALLPRDYQYPDASGNGQTSNPVAGKGSASVVSYHASNKSNSSNQHLPSYVPPSGSHSHDEGYDVKNLEAPRHDAFVAHPATTTAHRAGVITSSLADVRSKFNMQGAMAPDGGHRLTEQLESGRPRVIETVQEQNETSTTSNLKHAMQSTSLHLDLSSQLQLAKAAEAHNLCPWPSPFLHGAEVPQGQRQIVIDQETVGLDIQALTNLKQLKASQAASGLLQPGQNSMRPPITLSGIQNAADNIVPPPFNRSQASRNITATMPGSQITSQIDSQDFNEFNANETKSEEEPDDSQQHGMTDMPCTDRAHQQPRQEQQFEADNFGSSVPNAFRKVVHQPDSLGPPTASSCLTDNRKDAMERKRIVHGQTEIVDQVNTQSARNKEIRAAQSEIENQLQAIQRASASGNHQGSVAPQESEQTFLHRSYLKNISANQSAKQDEKQERIFRSGNAEEDQEQDVNEDTQSTASHAQHLHGARGYTQRTVPRNQNAIVYDSALDTQQYQPGPRHGSHLYCQSNSNSQNRIERSPLNEKVLIEELINNGYANHDGSQGKNMSGRARPQNGTPDASISNRDMALAERRNQVHTGSGNRAAKFMQIEENSQQTPAHGMQPAQQMTNTVPTTDGECQDDLSERVTTRPGADDLEKSKDHSTMAEVAEETNYQAKDLPSRVDPNMMALLRQRHAEHRAENRQSLRELLELPRDAPTEPNCGQTITVNGSQIASPFGQISRSQVAHTCVHSSFDVLRKVDSELQASPSRVMDDRQPGYNSRLEQLKDGTQQLSFDQQQRQQHAVQILFSDELAPIGSKQSFDLTPNCKLNYQFTIYNYLNATPKTNANPAIYETFKLFNPLKPKYWSLVLTRMSTATVASLKPSLYKLRALFQHRLQQQPFPQSMQQRAQLVEDLARLLAHCSEGMTAVTILVDSKGMRGTAEASKTRQTASQRSILDAFTGASHPAAGKEPKSKQARSVSSRPRIHEALHKEAELKREKRERLIKEREREVREKEVGECTFSPLNYRTAQDGDDGRRTDALMGKSAGCRPALLSSSDKRLQVPKVFGSVSNQGSCQSEHSLHVVPKVRSPETFYRDMMTFKERREAKLTSMRKVQDSLIKSKSCLNTKRFSSTQEADQFFENLSRAKKKLDTSSKSIKINLKSLAEQSNIQLFDNRNQKVVEGSPKSLDQRQELMQRLEKRSRSNQVTTTNSQAYTHEPTRNIGTAVCKMAKRTEPSTQSNKNLSQRSEMLYQDHFLRQSRLKTLQEKCVRFEAKQNLTERSQPTHKSNQIMANKIALQVKTEYDKIVEELKKSIMERRKIEKKKRTDVVIEEKSGESERDHLGSKRTGRSLGTGRNEEASESTDYLPQIDGLDLQRFVQLLSRLHYLSDVNDQRIIVQERTAIRNAWQLISHRDAGSEMSPFPADTPIANLRNLLIFLIGIENIFVESMANGQHRESRESQEEPEHRKSGGSDSQVLPKDEQDREPRSIGYFIGQNYFLEGEQDCLKLMQGFGLLVQNKLCYQRERQRLMTKAKLAALQQTEEVAGGPFHPAINKKSDQIMQEKSQGALYTRTSQSKAESLERRESLFQHTGYTSSARGTDHVASQKQSKDARLRKVGCKYEDFLISKAQQRKVKIEKMAKQVSKDETKECTFTPQINKNNLACVRGGRQRSKNSKTRANKENINSQACIPTQKMGKEDVFESLYKFAEVRREKSEDGKRTAQHFEKKQLRRQCPFKPNLSKTQKINKSVTSKIYHYKEPDLALLPLKDKKLARKAVVGFSALTTAMISNRRVSSTPRGTQGVVGKKGLNSARDQVNSKKHVSNTAFPEAPRIRAADSLATTNLPEVLSAQQLPSANMEDNMQSPAALVSDNGVFDYQGAASAQLLSLRPNLASLSLAVGNADLADQEQLQNRC